MKKVAKKARREIQQKAAKEAELAKQVTIAKTE